MKLKLDENLGQRGLDVLLAAGHEVATVTEQGLAGADDREVIAVCANEARCLVTMDLNFANPLSFPPTEYSGIAVLRLAASVTLRDIQECCETLSDGLKLDRIDGQLWIVERGRIRKYSPNQLS